MEGLFKVNFRGVDRPIVLGIADRPLNFAQRLLARVETRMKHKQSTTTT